MILLTTKCRTVIAVIRLDTSYDAVPVFVETFARDSLLGLGADWGLARYITLVLIEVLAVSQK